MAEAWKISAELEPNFVGGLIKNKFIKGTMFTVKTVGQMKTNIPYLSRMLDANTTTLCFVESNNTIYKLINNPTTDVTVDADWEPVVLGGISSAVEPIGEWDSAINQVVGETGNLQDTNAFGINGNFYYVINATGGRLITYAGLFRSQTLTVYDGDFVMSVGDYFALIRPTATWESMSKPTVITDYVNGTVISHTHAISDIVDLQTQLDLKFDSGDVADNTADFASVPDTAIIDKKFLTAHYYRAIEVYNQAEVDALIAGVGGGITFPGNADEIFFSDGSSGIAASSQFKYESSNNNLIIATALTEVNSAIGNNDLIFGPDHVIDGIDTTPKLNWSIIAGEAITIDMDVSTREVNNGAFFGYSNLVQTVAASGTFGIYSPFVAGTENELLASKAGNNVGTVVLGYRGKATASGAFVHGYTAGTTEKVLAAGDHSVAIFTNTANQTVGHGALANYSVIIGGLDHNIPNDSPRSVILGGDRIKAAAATPDTVYTPYLRVGQGNGITLVQSDAETKIAVIDSTTGEVKWRDASTFASSDGAWKTAGTSTLTATTTIDLGGNFLYFGYDFAGPAGGAYDIYFQGHETSNDFWVIGELYADENNAFVSWEAQNGDGSRGYFYVDGDYVNLMMQAPSPSSARMELDWTQAGGMLVIDEILNKGFHYDADYSANWTDLSLPDWGHVWRVTGTTTLPAGPVEIAIADPISGVNSVKIGSGPMDRVQESYGLGIFRDTNIFNGDRVYLGVDEGNGAGLGAAFIEFSNNFIGTASQWVNEDGSGNNITMTFGATGVLVNLSGTARQGMRYNADYAAYFTDRSIVDKAYVDSAAASGAGNYWPLGGTANASANIKVNATSSIYEFFWEFPDDPFFSGGGGLQINTGIAIWTTVEGSAGAEYSTLDFYDGTITVISQSPSFPGVEYSADFSGNYTARSLIDKGFGDANYWKLGANNTLGNSNQSINIPEGYILNIRETSGKVQTLQGVIASSPFWTVSAHDGAGGDMINVGIETAGTIVGVPWFSIWRVSNLTPSNVKDVVINTVSASGTPTDGYGGRYRFQLESSTTQHTDAADMEWSWGTAAHATRKGKLSLGAYNVAAREEFIAMNAGGNLNLYAPNGIIVADKPVQLPSYTVAGVPSASAMTGSLIYVSNETGGATIAFSDGTNWRRVQDRAIIA